jgi:hypothetical protein
MDVPALVSRIEGELTPESVRTSEAVHRAHSRLSQTQQQMQKDDNDDERLIAELERLLGRKLTAVEAALAVAWRREGKSASEIVDVLRRLDEILLRMLREKPGRGGKP